MTREVLTVHLQSRVLDALRSEARREGMDAAELAGRVLRAHLGFDVLDELDAAGNELRDEEALRIASEELLAERGGRRPPQGR